MKFMMMVKANADTEADLMPTEQEIAEMTKFNEQLVNAGVMLAGEGLASSRHGARVRFSGDKRTVIDGPFSEAKELVAGFWIIQAKSLEEAIEWARRCPNPTGVEGEIEIRKIMESEDMGEGFTPELQKAEEELRHRIAQQQHV